MKISETTLAQASAYRDFMESSHESRLRDLAFVMQDSPEIELMDGSVDSLVPLWTWAMAYSKQGLPAIPERGRPASALFLGEAAGRRDRFDVFGEMVEHYALEVAMRFWPGGELAVVEGIDKHDDSHRVTGLGLPAGGRVVIAELGRSFYFHNLLESRMPADALVKMVTDHRHDGTVPTGPSILTPLLDAPQQAWDDPARIPPLASDFDAEDHSEVAVSRAPGTALAETELIFAAIGTDVERLERADPLEEAAVAAVLADLGFKAEEPGLEHWLRVPEAEIVHASGAIMVDVFAHRKRLRALHFELHGSDEDNLAVVAAFTALGLRLHARLGSEDDWTNNR